MNIIISDTGAITTTKGTLNTAHNIADVIFYINKANFTTGIAPATVIGTLTEVKDFDINPSVIGLTFAYCGEKTHYYAYIAEIDYSLPERLYKCEFILSSDRKLTIPAVKLNYINDNNTCDCPCVNDYWLVTDRIIKPGKVNFIEQDSHSECVSFKIRRCYDGVSLLDENKVAAVDFIPAVWDEKDNNVSFLSSAIQSKVELDNEWMLLKWSVPQRVVRDAGKIKLALSIITPSQKDDNGNIIKDLYIWQTEPVEVIVRPNIGDRNNSENADEENFNTLDEIYNMLSNMEYVSHINTEDNTFILKKGINGEENVVSIDTLTEDIVAGDIDIDEAIDIVYGGSANG